jgi:hypothetical protein
MVSRMPEAGSLPTALPIWLLLPHTIAMLILRHQRYIPSIPRNRRPCCRQTGGFSARAPIQRCDTVRKTRSMSPIRAAFRTAILDPARPVARAIGGDTRRCRALVAASMGAQRLVEVNGRAGLAPVRPRVHLYDGFKISEWLPATMRGNVGYLR